MTGREDQPEPADHAAEELKGEILEILDEMKAQDVTTLHVAGQTTLADYFILCSGTSDRHCRAVADAVLHRLKDRGIRPLNPPDARSATWTLLDFGWIIVHVLSRDARQRYRLEQLWNTEGRGREDG